MTTTPEFVQAMCDMKHAFVTSFEDSDSHKVQMIADTFFELIHAHLCPVINKIAAPRSSAIPPTSKQLHAYTVWQKARIHGLIPADSIYRDMCPDDASKKLFYETYVLKIIAIDEKAAKSVFKTMLDTAVPKMQPEIKRNVSLNHMQLFRADYIKQFPKATIVEIRNAWANLSADEQKTYMIRAQA